MGNADDGGTADDALVPTQLKEYAEDLFKKLKTFDKQIDDNLKKHAEQLQLIELKREEVKEMEAKVKQSQKIVEVVKPKEERAKPLDKAKSVFIMIAALALVATCFALFITLYRMLNVMNDSYELAKNDKPPGYSFDNPALDKTVQGKN